MKLKAGRLICLILKISQLQKKDEEENVKKLIHVTFLYFAQVLNPKLIRK